MRNYRVILIVCLLLLLPKYAFSGLGDIRVSLLEGDVQMRSPEIEEWMPASVNMPVIAGDSIWVPEGGRLELQFSNGSCIRLDQNTALEIVRLEDGPSQFYLASGRVYVRFRVSGDSMIQFDTPGSSARAFEKAKFGLSVSDGSDTVLSVFKGVVYAESSAGKNRVTANYSLYLAQDGKLQMSPLASADEWVVWNKERDRDVYGRRYSQEYLPPELEAYASDFDNYGKWVYEGDYGYVWTPTVSLSVDWAPYSYGRWVWLGGDYVWISYDTWGWAPHHYGRWLHRPRIGWCWLPPVRGDVYWGPGYVGWVYTSGAVAWVPLAPGEIYYGYGNYGRHSLNIINFKADLSEIRPSYGNVQVANAVTVLTRAAFLRGNTGHERIKENPFLTARPGIGRPDIKPERSTFMPVIKEISREKMPPSSVRERKIKGTMSERPLIREQRGSVFKPGATQDTRQLKGLIEKGAMDRRDSGAAGHAPGLIGEPEKERKVPDTTSTGGKEIRKPDTGVQKERPSPPAVTQPKQPPKQVDTIIKEKRQTEKVSPPPREVPKKAEVPVPQAVIQPKQSPKQAEKIIKEKMQIERVSPPAQTEKVAPPPRREVPQSTETPPATERKGIEKGPYQRFK